MAAIWMIPSFALTADQELDPLEAVARAANDEDDPDAAEYWWDVLEILLD